MGDHGCLLQRCWFESPFLPNHLLRLLSSNFASLDFGERSGLGAVRNRHMELARLIFGQGC